MELLKLLSASEVVAQVISFLVLVFLLRRFLWTKMLAALDARKEKITGDLRQAQESRDEMARLKAEYDARLAGIEDAAQKKVHESILEGRAAAEEIRKKAHQDAQAILDTANKNIKYELAKAKEDLKETIIDLSLRGAESVIQAKMTGEDDRGIVRDFLSRVDEQTE